MTSRRRDDDGEGKGFLSRWSERKQAAEAQAGEPPAPQAGPGGDAEAMPPQPAGIDPADLPDIDSLEAGADFSVFMKQGVPQALQRRALRRLWQVDPAFREICMLDDYNLDYTDAAMVVPNLKTLFQVGRGMVLPEEAEKLAEAAADEGSPQDAPGPEASERPGRQAALPPGRPAAETPAQADPPPSRAPQEARKPGTPLVPPPATPAPAGAPERRDGPSRSARSRRWGDPDA